MNGSPGPRIKDRRTEITVGVLCIVAGSWWLWDAYEGRGHKRPYGLKLLPGA